MLTQEEAAALGSRLDELPCTDPETGDGLFTWVFQREPPDRSARYESHMRTCEHCRIALEVYTDTNGTSLNCLGGMLRNPEHRLDSDQLSPRAA